MPVCLGSVSLDAAAAAELGRSPDLSGAFVSERAWVGADVGGTKLLLVAVHEGGRAAHRTPTGPEAGPALIEREVRAFVDRHGLRLAAIGVALPGLIGTEGRVAACDVLPRLVGWSVADCFADLGCPVRALNDAEAALTEEAHDLGPGATAGLIMAGTGIGAAFLVHGRPLRGARGWAGELGYLPVAVQPGQVAWLDQLAGGAALAARLGVDGVGLRARAERGEPETLAAIRDAGHALGLGLAAVVNLLNPELLVLGGGACELAGYREAALASAGRHSLPDLWRACTVRSVRAGEAVAALGAARAAADGFRAEPSAPADRGRITSI
jgi:predicted NBD/HSP70 family sugar kinase